MCVLPGDKRLRPLLVWRRHLRNSVLTVLFISCLGLFGLASYTAEQRTKEIGIRKVLGASIPNLVILLSKEFIRLVVISFALAAPLAYHFMNDWLNDFAYHTSLG